MSSQLQLLHSADENPLHAKVYGGYLEKERPLASLHVKLLGDLVARPSNLDCRIYGKFSACMRIGEADMRRARRSTWNHHAFSNRWSPFLFVQTVQLHLGTR